LLRIAQEALTNVRKHANAARATVRFWCEPDGWHVSVRDDGIGFDPTAVAADAGGRHVGITIMRERAESVGGHLEVDSRPGEGAEVQAWVPGPDAARRTDDNPTSTPERTERLRGATTPAAG
jgi:signal transduction histidine kinase